MAAPKVDEILAELDQAMVELHTATAGENKLAEDSVAHCGLMIRVWSLRFQLGSVQRKASAMALASREAAEWEKRKSAAKRDIRTDILERELEHNAEQEGLAAELTDLH